MILLDSTFIIDFLKNKKEAFDILIQTKDEPKCSTLINYSEVLVGDYLEDQNRIEKTKNFFSSLYSVFSIDKLSAQKAAQLRAIAKKQGYSISLTDAFIAAIALTNNCNKIITKNKKDFEKLGLTVLEY